MVFACVGIAATSGTINSFSVAYPTTGSSTVVNASGQTLNFSFTLNQDLWKHDLFIIDFDSNFEITSESKCTSTASSGINFYNSTEEGQH
jgi:hypothetical protein